MTNEIDEIRARWAKATPGPFRVSGINEAGPDEWFTLCRSGAYYVICDWDPSLRRGDRGKADAEAIAAAPADLASLLTAYDAERALREALEEQLRAAERERAEAVDRADESDRQRTQACQRWAAAADELQAAREAWDGSNRTLTLRLAEVTSERDAAHAHIDAGAARAWEALKAARARAEKAERERDALRAQLAQAKAEGALVALAAQLNAVTAVANMETARQGAWSCDHGEEMRQLHAQIEARLAGEEPES